MQTTQWIAIVPIVIAVVVGLSGLLWLWWRFPKWQLQRLRPTVSDAKGRADVEDGFRKTIGQLIGGFAVIVGAGLAFLQFLQQQRAAHDLLISNQVTKAFELIGSEKVMVRIGGIYGLENAITDPQYTNQILETLIAYLRELGSKSRPGSGLPTPVDIQAVMTVIARHFTSQTGPVSLTDVDFPNANFPDATFDNADFARSNLPGANFSNSSLRRSSFVDAALQRATFFNAALNEANFSKANLSGASLAMADLRRANLMEADLSGASLVSARLEGVSLYRANLSNANFTNALISQSDLNGACGSNVQLPAGLELAPC